MIAINRDYGRLLQSLCALPQILIAAVQGAAMGGGVGLVCCADHVLAAPDAVFATPEVTLGLVPAQIAPFVVRRLGDARARDWLLSGARWSARQALVAGLVHAVVDGLAPSPLWGEGGGEGLSGVGIVDVVCFVAGSSCLGWPGCAPGGAPTFFCVAKRK